MTLSIELSQEEEARLAAETRRTGKPARQVLLNLVNENLPPLSLPREDSTLALFDEWDSEDANRTEDEVTAEAEFWREYRQSLNEVRGASGMREI